MSPIIDAHLHVWDETAGGKQTEPMPSGNYSPQAQAPIELFMVGIRFSSRPRRLWLRAQPKLLATRSKVSLHG